MILGELVKAVGLRGELRLRTSEDYWDAALASRGLRLLAAGDRRPVAVRSHRPQGPGVQVVGLVGIDDRDAAQAVVGSQLVLETAGLDVALPESPRPFQVCGLRVVLADGELVGTVADVLPMPAQPVLVVRSETSEHLVPWVDAIVREVDFEAGRITIDPPPGLLEI